MKKYAVYILTIVLLLCFTGCSSGGSVSSVAVQSRYHEFRLTPTVCNNLFSCNPNEVRSALKESPWVDGHFVSATENNEGNLLLVLSDEDIEFWKTAIGKKWRNTTRQEK